MPVRHEKAVAHVECRARVLLLCPSLSRPSELPYFARTDSGKGESESSTESRTLESDR